VERSVGSSGLRVTSMDDASEASTVAEDRVVDWPSCLQVILAAISRSQTCSPSSPEILVSGAADTCSRDALSCEEL